MAPRQPRRPLLLARTSSTIARRLPRRYGEIVANHITIIGHDPFAALASEADLRGRASCSEEPSIHLREVSGGRRRSNETVT
jgi:hypothetical protein